MKLVFGIVRTTSLERIVQSLERIGINNMTISEIKGLGEELRLNNPYSIHDKIEVITSDEKAGTVVTVLDVLRRTYDLTRECDCDHMPVPMDEEIAYAMKAAEELISATERLLG
jgi:hypothetical protein